MAPGRTTLSEIWCGESPSTFCSRQTVALFDSRTTATCSSSSHRPWIPKLCSRTITTQESYSGPATRTTKAPSTSTCKTTASSSSPTHKRRSFGNLRTAPFSSSLVHELVASFPILMQPYSLQHRSYFHTAPRHCKHSTIDVRSRALLPFLRGFCLYIFVHGSYILS